MKKKDMFKPTFAFRKAEKSFTALITLSSGVHLTTCAISTYGITNIRCNRAHIVTITP